MQATQELCREACRDTQTIANHLVGAPNFRFGGHEFESSVRQELGALTKAEKGQVFLHEIIFVNDGGHSNCRFCDG